MAAKNIHALMKNNILDDHSKCEENMVTIVLGKFSGVGQFPFLPGWMADLAVGMTKAPHHLMEKIYLDYGKYWKFF